MQIKTVRFLVKCLPWVCLCVSLSGRRESLRMGGTGNASIAFFNSLLLANVLWPAGEGDGEGGGQVGRRMVGIGVLPVTENNRLQLKAPMPGALAPCAGDCGSGV